ncbi:hypothetical protein ACFLU5_09860, partial [Bacteroidota bacterium]
MISLSDQSRDVIDELNLASEITDISNTRELRVFMNNLYDRGYLLASYDTHPVNDSATLVRLETGQAFHWIRLNHGNMTNDFSRQVGIHLEQYDDREVSYSEVSTLFSKILDYTENTGYPFATMRLDAINIDIMRKTLTASLNYIPGPYIIFDSLIVENTRTKTSFLMAYLGFRKGESYNQEKISMIGQKISRLKYLELTEPPKINFKDSTYAIIISLQDRSSNNFNGVVGLFPNENESGKMLITGMVYLGLKNLFNSGKEFEFDWNKPNIQTQELIIDYTHPNLFRSSIGMSLIFDLFKQDSTFLNRGGSLEFDFQGINKGSFGIQASLQASEILNSSQLESQDRFADYNITYYGLNYEISDYDDWILPRKGWDLYCHFNIGSKSVESGTNSNNDINSSAGNLQSTFLFSVGRFFPIKKRSTI